MNCSQLCHCLAQCVRIERRAHVEGADTVIQRRAGGEFTMEDHSGLHHRERISVFNACRYSCAILCGNHRERFAHTRIDDGFFHLTGSRMRRKLSNSLILEDLLGA